MKLEGTFWYTICAILNPAAHGMVKARANKDLEQLQEAGQT